MARELGANVNEAGANVNAAPAAANNVNGASRLPDIVNRRSARIDL